MTVLAPPLSAAVDQTGAVGRTRRINPKLVWTVVWIVMGLAAVYFLAPQAGALAESIDALRRVHPGWIAAALATVVARYAAAALSLAAATTQTLPFTPTVMVQLATSFVGRLTPEGLGWLVLNQRYLEKVGLARSDAAAALTLRIGAGAIVRVVIIAVVAFLLGRNAFGTVEVPVSTPVLLGGLAAVAALAAVAGYVARGRAPRLIASIRTGATGVATTLRDPRRSAVLFGGSAAVTVGYVLTLAFSVSAVGGALPFPELFGMYLAATAIAAASPTPGNLGALELTLAAGLASLGLESGAAMAAVLVFRLLTFWAPLLPGFLAFRYLQHREHI